MNLSLIECFVNHMDLFSRLICSRFSSQKTWRSANKLRVIASHPNADYSLIFHLKFPLKLRNRNRFISLSFVVTFSYTRASNVFYQLYATTSPSPFNIIFWIVIKKIVAIIGYFKNQYRYILYILSRAYNILSEWAHISIVIIFQGLVSFTKAVY